MAFDAEGFRNAAKGKFTDAEIEDVIARETVSKPTAVSPSNSITTTEIAPAEVAPAGRQTPLQRMETFNQKVAEEHPVVSTLPYLAAGGAGAAALATLYGGAKAGKAIYNSLSDKMAGGQPPSGGQPSSGSPMQKIDPDLTVSQKPTGTLEPTFDWRSYSPTQTTGEPTLNMQTLAPEQAANSPIEQLKARLTAAPTIAPEAPVPPPVAPVETVQPVKLSPWALGTQPVSEIPTTPTVVPSAAEQAAIEKLTTTAPVEPAKPVPPPEVPKVIEVPTGPLKTGTGKPAFAGEAPPSEGKQRFKTEYSDISKVPKGYAFVPGGQAIDTVRNNLGQETYTRQFSGRDFPKDYPEALELGERINRDLGRPTREEMLAQGIKPPEPTPGITQKISGRKIVKVAGITGALIAVSDIAKAAQKGKYGEAAAQSVDLVTDFIPGVGTVKTALSGMGLNANEEEQLKQLQYRARVGYGRGMQGSTGGGQGFRGIAPPR